MPQNMRQIPKSKKQAILDAAQALDIRQASDAEIRRIQTHIAQQGVSAKPAISYIVRTLRQAGLPVHTRFADAPIQEPYASQLKGLLRFQELDAAETSLRALNKAFEEYRQIGDQMGMHHVRRLALKGKQRASAIAQNPRVGPANRKVKLEIVNWFRVWLESPELFFVWLEVRKQSEEFRSLNP
jgi:hypothetical protein